MEKIPWSSFNRSHSLSLSYFAVRTKDYMIT
jgi:hypothetical protein